MSIDPMHIRGGGDGGTGKKPSDNRILSGRHDLHALQHQIGEYSFFRRVVNGEIPDVVYPDKLLVEAFAALAEKRYREALTSPEYLEFIKHG
jgi:hypothetical protein